MFPARPTALQVMSPCLFVRRNRDGLMRRVNVGRLKCFINTRHGGGTEGGLSRAPDAKVPKLRAIN